MAGSEMNYYREVFGTGDPFYERGFSHAQWRQIRATAWLGVLLAVVFGFVLGLLISPTERNGGLVEEYVDGSSKDGWIVDEWEPPLPTREQDRTGGRAERR